MHKMQHEVPSFEAPPPAEIVQLVEALMGSAPLAPSLAALFLDPDRQAERDAANRALRELDWANLGRYQQANAECAAAGRRPDLVFMGDSITELWQFADPGFFNAARLCRGISGQTSPQMLLRFQADVVALRPRAVHLLAGANDIAGNTGPTTPQRFYDNMLAMIKLAKANGIVVVLGLLTPASMMPWTAELDRAPWIAAMNGWLRQVANEEDCILVDYFSAMAGDDGGLPATFSHDGLHPNRLGYESMAAVLGATLKNVDFNDRHLASQ